MDEVQVQDELAGIAEDLGRCWQAALTLKAGRLTWSRLGSALEGYGNAGVLMRQWYVHWMLAGCRRLLDRRRDTVSVPRALDRLARIAPNVTRKVVAEVWSQSGHHSHAEDMVRQSGEALTRVMDAAPNTVERLTRAAVRTDVVRLVALHDRVVRLAHLLVAHEPVSRPEELRVTDDEINALLRDVLEVTQKWNVLAEGVHLSPEIGRLTGTEPIARALELFDWGSYVQAIGTEEQRRWNAWDAPAGTRDLLEREVKLRFVWDASSMDESADKA